MSFHDGTSRGRPQTHSSRPPRLSPPPPPPSARRATEISRTFSLNLHRNPSLALPPRIITPGPIGSPPPYKQPPGTIPDPLTLVVPTEWRREMGDGDRISPARSGDRVMLESRRLARMEKETRSEVLVEARCWQPPPVPFHNVLHGRFGDEDDTRSTRRPPPPPPRPTTTTSYYHNTNPHVTPPPTPDTGPAYLKPVYRPRSERPAISRVELHPWYQTSGYIPYSPDKKKPLSEILKRMGADECEVQKQRRREEEGYHGGEDVVVPRRRFPLIPGPSVMGRVFAYSGTDIMSRKYEEFHDTNHEKSQEEKEKGLTVEEGLNFDSINRQRLPSRSLPPLPVGEKVALKALMTILGKDQSTDNVHVHGHHGSTFQKPESSVGEQHTYNESSRNSVPSPNVFGTGTSNHDKPVQAPTAYGQQVGTKSSPDREDETSRNSTDGWPSSPDKIKSLYGLGRRFLPPLPPPEDPAAVSSRNIRNEHINTLATQSLRTPHIQSANRKFQPRITPTALYENPHNPVNPQNLPAVYQITSSGRQIPLSQTARQDFVQPRAQQFDRGVVNPDELGLRGNMVTTAQIDLGIIPAGDNIPSHTYAYPQLNVRVPNHELYLRQQVQQPPPPPPPPPHVHDLDRNRPINHEYQDCYQRYGGPGNNTSTDTFRNTRIKVFSPPASTEILQPKPIRIPLPPTLSPPHPEIFTQEKEREGRSRQRNRVSATAALFEKNDDGGEGEGPPNVEVYEKTLRELAGIGHNFSSSPNNPNDNRQETTKYFEKLKDSDQAPPRPWPRPLPALPPQSLSPPTPPPPSQPTHHQRKSSSRSFSLKTLKTPSKEQLQYAPDFSATPTRRLKLKMRDCTPPRVQTELEPEPLVYTINTDAAARRSKERRRGSLDPHSPTVPVHNNITVGDNKTDIVYTISPTPWRLSRPPSMPHVAEAEAAHQRRLSGFGGDRGPRPLEKEDWNKSPARAQNDKIERWLSNEIIEREKEEAKRSKGNGKRNGRLSGPRALK